MKSGGTNNDRLCVDLIIDSIDSIFDYILEVEKESFISNQQLQDACLMRLIVIGEYAGKISNSLKARHPEVEWKSMAAARNFYVHVYASVHWE